MTPVQMQIMLHHYYSPEPLQGPRGEVLSPAQRDGIQYFLRQGMLEPKPDTDEIQITGKGRAYVQMLKNTPMPKAEVKWVDPRDETVVEIY